MTALRLFFIASVILSLALVKSSGAYASQLQWTASYPLAEYSGYIKISDINNNVIYSGIKTPGSFDLIYSEDGGNFWVSKKANLPSGSDINWIALSPIDEVSAVSLWGSGVFLTENSGSSWSNIFPSATPRSVAINPTDIDNIYVGIGGSNSGSSGLYKTTNNGSSWTKMTSLGDRNNAQITIDKDNPLRVFADADPSFYRTLDGGATWTLLGLDHAYSHGTVIDKVISNRLYTGRYDINPGVYRSDDNGATWTWKNSGPVGIFVQIVQDTDGTIYGSRVNSGGGVWRSMDGAETWENVGDPAWGTANTWGLDAVNGRIAVSVEGRGIYVATSSAFVPPPPPPPPPPPGPNPVVFIPGFGGSWSFKGLVLDLPTDYSDWELIPKFADSYYLPLINTLKSAGLQDTGAGQDLFIYGYDFRKSITDSASKLNNFLDEQVVPKNPGEKTDVIAHSMGGLVARYCFQMVPGCADKIDQIITGGSPHFGTLHAYDFWEAGKIHENDLMLRYAERLILHLQGFPKLNPKTIVQTEFPGVRDLLPIFDYIENRPYSDLTEAQNPVLASIDPPSASYVDSLLTLSGNKHDTQFYFSPKKRSPHEILLGWWADGKPDKYATDVGDATVLKSSSEIANAENNGYSVEHKDYFNNAAILSDILAHLGLTANPITAASLNNIFSIIGSANITISLPGLDKFSADVASDQRSLFISDPKPNYLIEVQGLSDGDFAVLSTYVDLDEEPVLNSVKGEIKQGETVLLFVKSK